MRNVMRNKKGFTFIELIIVVVIVGILAAISVPLFLNFSQAARIAATRGTLGAIRSTVGIQYAMSATGGNSAAYPSTVDSSMFIDHKNFTSHNFSNVIEEEVDPSIEMRDVIRVSTTRRVPLSFPLVKMLHLD